jgi:hypothetical protein
MPATFDGDNLRITLPAATPEVDAKVDLYSDWKEWLKTAANAKYPVAFDTTGGDPTTATGKVAAYYFLRNDNGWRIKPAEEDAEVTIVGNLYPRDATLPMFVETTGAFTVLLSVERDASSVVEISGSGVTAQDKLDIADEVRVELTAELAAVLEARQLLRNKRVLDPATGIETIYDDAGIMLFTRQVFTDKDGTAPYDGTEVPHRVDRYS